MTEHGQWLLAVFFLSCALAGIAYALSWFAIQFSRWLIEFVHWLRCKVIEWRIRREVRNQVRALRRHDDTSAESAKNLLRVEMQTRGSVSATYRPRDRTDLRGSETPASSLRVVR